MKEIKYSKDVDILMIELSDKAIAYAEDDGQVILHYSDDDSLVLVEIMDFRRLMPAQVVSELLAA
ncbi:MAG: DUF2283 domain-containing protein [Phormidesmis sp.]